MTDLWLRKGRKALLSGQAGKWGILRRGARWWGMGVLSVGLTLVNGPLVISLGVALVAHRQLAQLSPEQWQHLLQSWQQWLHQRWLRGWSSQQKTWLLSGTLLVGIYLATSTWNETHTLAGTLAIAAQTVLVCLALGILLRLPRPQSPDPVAQWEQQVASLEQGMMELSHPDPLRRLVAVRRVMRLFTQLAAQAPSMDAGGISFQAHLIDCFHLMLAQEQEPLVRTALREGLARLRQPLQLSAGAPPVPTPETWARSHSSLAQPRRRPVVEYIEPEP